MNAHWTSDDERATLYLGDCLDVMRGMPDNSVDSIVTDPPYGLTFMGKAWDKGVPSVDVWREALRVLKPGGHLLAFAGTRTQHRMAVAIEDAGFEIRDMIAWVYGSGFPKSLDVSKAIDKAAGAERKVVNTRKLTGKARVLAHGVNNYGGEYGRQPMRETYDETAPATDAAREWQGWGTALKPALEPVTVARKPLTGTVAANVLEWGTGGINVDGCRVPIDAGDASSIERQVTGFNRTRSIGGNGKYAGGDVFDRSEYVATQGRWPANLIHDGSDEVVGGFPETHGAGTFRKGSSAGRVFPSRQGETADKQRPAIDAGGSAARFFKCCPPSRFAYIPKANKRDRNEGLPEGTTSSHPTVKPTALMQYLCRLITPPDGVVLDPFTGSGSTGKAAMLEGFRFIGIELDADYLAIASARIAHAAREPQTRPASHPKRRTAQAGDAGLFGETS